MSTVAFEDRWTEAGVFFEIVVKMRWIIKAETIANFCNIPIRMLQQALGFRHNSIANHLCSGFSGMRFYNVIEVVDMYIQVIGKLRCAF